MSHRTHLSVASALVTAGLLVAAGNAQALDAEVSGHVNRAVLFADNGEQNQLTFVDNEASNTRFRFTGSEEVMPGIKAGIKWEMEFVSNNSSAVDFSGSDDDANISGNFEINERHQDIYLSGAFGKFSLGQGDTAGNGAAEVDLAGTSMGGYSSFGDIGGSFTFEDGTAFGYSNFDFNSRQDRVRYDTPAIGPATIAVSYGVGTDGEDLFDVAARASTEMAGVGKLAAALAYSRADEPGVDERTRVGGSASFLHDLGASVTVAYIRQSFDEADTDDDTIYVKLGYQMGMHAVSVDYGLTSLDSGNDFSGYGAQYSFKPVGWADMYVGVKQHAADLDVGSDPDNITIATVGTRIKF